MSSDASQSILRLALLACATAAFMVVWAGDSGRTVGMTLAERNRQVSPGHAATRPNRTELALKTPRVRKPANAAAPRVHIEAAPNADLAIAPEPLPAGSYRVVFEDGRVEWLTVIDRNSESSPSQPPVITTTVNGQRAHLIRVSTHPGLEPPLR